eukprot:scaffold321357_cov48-Tisochrysis_lutea.AAC.1
MEAIYSDVQAILWDRNPCIQADKPGISQVGLRWINFPTHPRVGYLKQGDAPLQEVAAARLSAAARAAT